MFVVTFVLEFLSNSVQSNMTIQNFLIVSIHTIRGIYSILFPFISEIENNVWQWCLAITLLFKYNIVKIIIITNIVLDSILPVN